MIYPVDSVIQPLNNWGQLNEKANKVYKNVEGENLSKYETNKLQYGKCLVRYLRTRCFCIRNLTLPLRPLVRFLFMSTIRAQIPNARTFHDFTSEYYDRSLRQSSEIFGHFRKGPVAFGNLPKVVGNLRKIVKNVDISMSI